MCIEFPCQLNAKPKTSVAESIEADTTRDCSAFFFITIFSTISCYYTFHIIEYQRINNKIFLFFELRTLFLIPDIHNRLLLPFLIGNIVLLIVVLILVSQILLIQLLL